jgi:hypothetical protein
MKVYLVWEYRQGDILLCHVCSDKEKATERWNEIRLRLIKELEIQIAREKIEKWRELWQIEIENLQETNPDKLDNEMLEPFITSMELE